MDNFINKIITLWKESKLPIINSLVKVDGGIWGISGCEVYEGKSVQELSVIFDEEFYTTIDIFTQVSYENNHFYAGDGGYESDGWILALTQENELLWLLFSDTLEPIKKLWIEHEILHAQNDLGIEVLIPLNSPEKLQFRREG